MFGELLLTILVLYIFFKLLLRSKSTPMRDLDFRAELESIREWKEAEAIEAEKTHVGVGKKIWNKIF